VIHSINRQPIPKVGDFRIEILRLFEERFGFLCHPHSEQFAGALREEKRLFMPRRKMLEEEPQRLRLPTARRVAFVDEAGVVEVDKCPVLRVEQMLQQRSILARIADKQQRIETVSAIQLTKELRILYRLNETARSLGTRIVIVRCKKFAPPRHKPGARGRVVVERFCRQRIERQHRCRQLLTWRDAPPMNDPCDGDGDEERAYREDQSRAPRGNFSQDDASHEW
jgi:hypothetical protein